MLLAVEKQRMVRAPAVEDHRDVSVALANGLLVDEEFTDPARSKGGRVSLSRTILS